MLVVGAADPLRMLLTLLARECHTDVKRDRLPATDSGNHSKEEAAGATSQPTEALMVSSERSSHPSNHEGGLTGASHITAQRQGSQLISPLIPAKAGTQGSPRSLFGREAASQNQNKPPGLSWIPAFAGTSGVMSGKPRP